MSPIAVLYNAIEMPWASWIGLDAAAPCDPKISIMPTTVPKSPISGAIAGFAGVLWLAFFGSVDSTAGTGYEFEVVAAVVVGGVAIFGGSGSVLGAALGALLLNTIASSLVVINISSYWVQAIQGALLIIAIAFDRLVSLRLAPALRTRRSTRE